MSKLSWLLLVTCPKLLPKSLLPTPESLPYRSTYYGSIAPMRANLSKHFLSLNEGLQQSVDQLKSEVTNVLVNLKKGHLGNLTKERDAKFLGVITELLDKYNNQLELGFRTLWESQVSYEGLIPSRGTTKLVT
ncbi:hypothetical protein [Moorena sp. SIO3I8]|uniref:hypothetical protein n=2 Tax=unclassified Moorena TaxID=2683338 RepID=UPI0013C294C7|nr:hypothetical protein [Moorena sp. SIO3I8]NEO05421.1 hypothetical protein [Moorena sp. SIO3I8]